MDVWLEGVTGRGVVIAVVDDGEFTSAISDVVTYMCMYMHSTSLIPRPSPHAQKNKISGDG